MKGKPGQPVTDRNHRQDRQVRRRRVFYIPGYDPFPARRYRELYRTEAARQGRISGYLVKIVPRRRSGNYSWRVRARIGGAECETEFEVLEWADLVRHSMKRSIPATYGMLLRTALVYLRSGALRALMGLRKGPVIAAAYPVVMLTAQLLVALALAAGAGGWAGRQVSPWLGWPLAVVLLVLLLRGFRRLDRHLYAHYLMHDYAWSAARSGAWPSAMEERIAAFAADISEALGVADVDEVLVVGHSSGAHVAVSAVARLVRGGGVPADGPALSLLTLGHVVPMVSFLPRAHGLRRDLHDLSRVADLFWLDVTAPGDGCCFALCDPVAVTGVAPPDKRWPLVISAAFTQTIEPARWRRLRWRFFRLHFQYLCAFDRPGAYDYFRITAGPRTLAARFGGRAPSKSRIAVPASPHREMAP